MKREKKKNRGHENKRKNIGAALVEYSSSIIDQMKREIMRIQGARTDTRRSMQHWQNTHRQEQTESITEATFKNVAYVLIPTCTYLYLLECLKQ